MLVRTCCRLSAVLVLPALAVLGWPAAAHADSISLHGGAQNARATNAYNTFGSQSDSVATGGASSWSQTTQAHDTDRSGYESHATVVTALGQSALDLDMTLQASHYQGYSGYGSGSVFGVIYFQALEDLDYVLSGALTIGSGSGRVQQRVFLVEDGTGNYLFDTYGYLDSTSATALSGSGLTGTLEAGTAYQLYFEYWLGTNAYNGHVAGTGDLLLTFRSTSSPVPEPGTLGLLGVGLLGLALQRRRTRARYFRRVPMSVWYLTRP